MKITFNSTHKPRQFSIKPRYYDPEREDKELRRIKYSEEEIQDTEKRMRARMARRWHKRDDQSKSNAKKKTLMYFAAVALIIYFLFIRN